MKTDIIKLIILSLFTLVSGTLILNLAIGLWFELDYDLPAISYEKKCLTDTGLAELAVKIAHCESKFKNVPNSDGSRYGIGVMQIVQTTFDENCEGDVWNADDNIRCAVKMMAKGELWRWDMSRHCWDN